MPSGTYVTADYGCFRQNDCYLDLVVYPLAEDFGNSEGLCGNYNGDDSDDLTIQGTTTVDSGDEPIDFVTSYMYVAIYLFTWTENTATAGKSCVSCSIQTTGLSVTKLPIHLLCTWPHLSFF